MFEEELNEELASPEALLASFRPTPLKVDRDQVMFLAGRASVRAGSLPGPPLGDGEGRPWALAGMTALAATLLVMLVLQGRPGIADWVQSNASPDRRSADIRRQDIRRQGAERNRSLARARASRGQLFSTQGLYEALMYRMAIDGFDGLESPAAASTPEVDAAVGPAALDEVVDELSYKPDSSESLAEWMLLFNQSGTGS